MRQTNFYPLLESLELRRFVQSNETCP